MTLPTGTITMSQVNTELCNPSASTITLNDTKVRGIAKIPSGTISMDDLRGETAPLVMSGGTKLTPGDGYVYHFFTSTTSITYYPSCSPFSIEMLLVGGGGASTGTLAGGGGAGGFRQVSVTLPNPAAPNTIKVGGGGGFTYAFGVYAPMGGTNPSGNPGQGAAGASGGGGGGLNPQYGGSGPINPYPTPIGNPGGDTLCTPTDLRGAGGGGGAGGTGFSPTEPFFSPSNKTRGGTGGSGKYLPGWTIPPSYGETGPVPGSPGVTAQYFSGGGGGCAVRTPSTPPTENAPHSLASRGGGGGHGGFYDTTPSPSPTAATNGDANTGGGAGGPAGFSPPPSNYTYGGSGIVIIRYPV